MKVEIKDKNILFSYTELADIFFTEYLSSAKGDYVKVYLYMLFMAKHNREIKLNDMSKSLSLNFNIIKEAITYWEKEGVVTKKTNSYVLNDLQELELHKLYKPKITISPEDLEKKQKNQYRAQAIEDINNNFFNGIMSPSWYYDIELWFKKYGFSEQVMIALFNYCYEKSALNRNYVQTVATSWSNSNVKTYADLEKYDEKKSKLNKIGKSIAKKLGFKRDLSEYEQEYIERWILTYGYSLEIIELALKRSTSKTNPTFDYFDKIITDWHERNLKTIDEINKYLENAKQKNQFIKNVNNNKASNYNNYTQRNYDNFDSLYANINRKKDN